VPGCSRRVVAIPAVARIRSASRRASLREESSGAGLLPPGGASAPLPLSVPDMPRPLSDQRVPAVASRSASSASIRDRITGSRSPSSTWSRLYALNPVR